jgi:hypothetical protein
MNFVQAMSKNEIQKDWASMVLKGEAQRKVEKAASQVLCCR